VAECAQGLTFPVRGPPGAAPFIRAEIVEVHAPMSVGRQTDHLGQIAQSDGSRDATKLTGAD